MPPVADNVVRALREVHARLAEVLALGDWQRLGEIDQLIRALLERLAAGPALDDAALAAKRDLQALHEQARQQGSRELERLRQLLMSHLEYAEGRSAYMHIDRVLAGR
ncbi:conserved hypothetical protein [Pseudomonas knackmussii B13]|uniref:Flagellar protein FliT n=1 Tax=Pseudomonas knackmussii (strain DSM 6978 / CCUG 54928 / LMG 23759 / B13) TaxID=1301098 RepID=A0A024HFS4_PSEKB|nr:hypothetical protein [Pseudomonas knackmussii]CDF83880.1 conserved hypothetical protein [Pseudomonas knackmussii B13]